MTGENGLRRQGVPSRQVGKRVDGVSRRRENAVFPVRGNAAKLGTRQGCVESSALGRAHNARQGV